MKIEVKRGEPRLVGTEGTITTSGFGFLLAHLLTPGAGSEVFGDPEVADLVDEFEGPVAWLEELYVSEDHREEGIGTRHMKTMLEELRTAGMDAAILQANPEWDEDRDRLIRFYQKFGFKLVADPNWMLLEFS